MATIAQLLMRIENRLQLAAGPDVQIHAEDKLLETMREVYETVFDEGWWRTYLFNKTYTLDGVTGMIVGDLSADIKRYEDIHSAFLGSDSLPLPMMTVGQNVTRIHRHAITPVPDKTKIFKVVPTDVTDTITVWYRTRLDESVWLEDNLDTEIYLDDHLMIFGVCADFLIDEGMNDNAAEKFAAKYQARLKKLKQNEWQNGISKSPQIEPNALTEWTEASDRGW